MSDQSNTPEWQVISQLVSSIQDEQKRARRWGIFFKSLFYIVIFSLIAMGVSNSDSASMAPAKSHVAIVNVFGPILAGSNASAEKLLPSIEDAFTTSTAKAVMLNINSPGGSPVQAGILFDEIQRLKALYPDKPVYAVISDTGASGAYYIAAAADFIYADKASSVGSIGVVGSGFGFTELIAKLGIERRTYTAGKNKDFLDPFLPQNLEDALQFQAILDEVHQQFIEQVKVGRGDRLSGDPAVFSGAIFHGKKALELGLVDGLGSLYSVVRDQADGIDVVYYSPEKTPFEAVVDELGVQTSSAVSWGLNQGFTLQ